MVGAGTSDMVAPDLLVGQLLGKLAGERARIEVGK
jgi:hypothetical protein